MRHPITKTTFFIIYLLAFGYYLYVVLYKNDNWNKPVNWLLVIIYTIVGIRYIINWNKPIRFEIKPSPKMAVIAFLL